MRGQTVCLWAPREILETARMQPVAVTWMQPVETVGIESVAVAGQLPELLYGRNMWDAALNAYTYDVYPEEVQQLYCWMEAFSEKARIGRDEAGMQKTAETEMGAIAQEAETASGMVEAIGKAETTGGTEEVAGEKDIATQIRENVELAFSLGANCVLLPKGMVEFEPDAVKWADVAELSEYYLLIRQL